MGRQFRENSVQVGVSDGLGYVVPMTTPVSAPFSVRSATYGDALAIAEVQVALWHIAYRGILPDAVIAEIRVPDRQERWEDIMNAYEVSGRGAVFVAEKEGRVVGFLSCGDQRDEELAPRFPAEISALYVEAQRQGIGRALMAAGAQWLIELGHDAGALWVFSDNLPARRFYEALGGTVLVERSYDEAREIDHLAYGWTSLSDLAARR